MASSAGSCWPSASEITPRLFKLIARSDRNAPRFRAASVRRSSTASRVMASASSRCPSTFNVAPRLSSSARRRAGTPPGCAQRVRDATPSPRAWRQVRVRCGPTRCFVIPRRAHRLKVIRADVRIVIEGAVSRRTWQAVGCSSRSRRRPRVVLAPQVRRSDQITCRLSLAFRIRRATAGPSTCRTALLFTSAMPLRTLEPRGSPAYLLASCVEFEGRLAQVKMSSGRNADTRTLGTSTSSLIARSTATLQIAYACWRLKPRSWTR